MENEKQHKFNVLNWDFNNDKLIHYDVLPYFRQKYEEYVKYNKDGDSKYHPIPKSIEDFKIFVENESQHQFWSRCEYEVIVHGWPVHKYEHKLDVHEQIMMNINTISELLFNELTTN